MLVVEDLNKNPHRLAIYNSTYNTVKIGKWIIIKQPFMRLATDGLKVLRVSDPSDLIFVKNQPDIIQDEPVGYIVNC